MHIFSISRYRLALIIVFSFWAPLTYSQNITLQESYRQYSSGAIDEAQLTTTVLNAAENSVDINQSIAILNQFRDSIRKTRNNTQIYLKLGQYSEMIGNYTQAINAYNQLISLIQKNSDDFYRLILKVAVLHFNTGQFEQALSHVEYVLLNTQKKEFNHHATILRIRIQGFMTGFEESIQNIKVFIAQNNRSPKIRLAYYTLYELYHLNGARAEAQNVQKEIARLFPKSVERAMTGDDAVSANIIAYPTPIPILQTVNFSEHLNTNSPHLQDGGNIQKNVSDGQKSAQSNAQSAVPAIQTVTAIQTGSFANINYALFQKKQLEALSYETKIITVTSGAQTFHKVRVFVDEASIAQSLVTLKAHDIDGFIVRKISDQ